MAAWRSFFENPLPIASIKQSIIILIAHIGVFLSIAIYQFNKKDILS
jgi:ABC-type transport system involved in multi-copper enzyme maturation permease subunit